MEPRKGHFVSLFFIKKKKAWKTAVCVHRNTSSKWTMGEMQESKDNLFLCKIIQQEIRLGILLRLKNGENIFEQNNQHTHTHAHACIYKHTKNKTNLKVKKNYST